MKKTKLLFLALLLQQQSVFAQYDGAIEISSLTEAQVLVVEGIDASDGMGRSVSSIGDFNNDGIDDVIVGRSGNDYGRAVIIYGNAYQYDNPLNINQITGGNGFILKGNPVMGMSVSSAGDFNGDGIDDLIVASRFYANVSVEDAVAYILFGNTSPMLQTVDLTQISPTEGVKINKPITDDAGNYKVSNAGDFNGDGFDDIMVSAYDSDMEATLAGNTYVIYGDNSLASHVIELDDINGTNGINIIGGELYDLSGIFLASAGDFNGDSFDDILITTEGAQDDYKGHVYLLFGSDNPAHPFALSNTNGSNGVKFTGESDFAFAGYGVAGNFDFNADGLDDIIIGSYGAKPYSYYDAGKAYVIYGTDAVLTSPFSVDAIDGSNGTEIRGLNPKGRFGKSVSGIGDFNGDHIDDIIVGAPASDVRGWGAVFYGKTSPPAIIDAWPLFKEDGFRIQSSGNYLNRFGDAVSSAGDFNNDGLADVIIGSWSEDVGLEDAAGRAYILYGNDTIFQSQFEGDL